MTEEERRDDTRSCARRSDRDALRLFLLSVRATAGTEAVSRFRQTSARDLESDFTVALSDRRSASEYPNDRQLSPVSADTYARSRATIDELRVVQSRSTLFQMDCGSAFAGMWSEARLRNRLQIAERVTIDVEMDDVRQTPRGLLSRPLS